MKSNIISILTTITCIALLLSCGNNNNANTSDDELMNAANELAKLSCQSKYLTGKELEELDKKGEELGNRIAELYLHNEQDSIKFIAYLFEAQDKICGDNNN